MPGKDKSADWDVLPMFGEKTPEFSYRMGEDDKAQVVSHANDPIYASSIPKASLSGSAQVKPSGGGYREVVGMAGTRSADAPKGHVPSRAYTPEELSALADKMLAEERAKIAALDVAPTAVEGARAREGLAPSWLSRYMEKQR